MITKFSARRLLSSSFNPIMVRRLTVVMIASVCLLLVSGCVALFRPMTPVLHKPSACDLSPVLTLQLPEQISALDGFPRSEIIAEGGTNKLTGQRHASADIKDWFYMRSGKVEYQVMIFYSNTGCAEWYESHMEDWPVFLETTENGIAGRVHYTEEPRADPEGGSGPMGYYISRADFRLRNLYVRVVTRARRNDGEKPQNDRLAKAVSELGLMLAKAFESNN